MIVEKTFGLFATLRFFLRKKTHFVTWDQGCKLLYLNIIFQRNKYIYLLLANNKYIQYIVLYCLRKKIHFEQSLIEHFSDCINIPKTFVHEQE